MLRHSKIVWAPVSARLLQATIEFSKRWPLNGVVYKGEMWKHLGQRVLLLPVHPLVHNTGFIFLKSSAGFWQYGTLQWDEFYRYIIAFVLTKTGWTIFQYDTTQQQYSAPCQWSSEICYGRYKLIHLFCCTWPWVNTCDVSWIFPYLHVTVRKYTWHYVGHFRYFLARDCGYIVLYFVMITRLVMIG